MKRFVLFLLIGLMLAAPALAAFDPGVYEIEGAYGTQVLALLGGGALTLHRSGLNVGYFPTSVVRWEAGVCTLREMLAESEQPVARTLAAFENGRCGLAEEAGGVITWREITRDALGEVRTLGAGLDELEAHACGLTALERTDGGDVLWLFDGELERVAKLALPYKKASVLGVCADEDGYLLLVGSKLGYEATAMRLNAAGEIIWQRTVNKSRTRYNRIYPDALGGALLSGSLEADYKQACIAHISASGEIDAEKMLRAKNTVIGTAHAIANGDGTVMIYGSAVAHSRGLYDAFALTVDTTLKVGALDVRDFSAREDYGFEYRAASDGTVYVYTPAEGFGSSERKNALLVPFDMLDAAEDPGITLR